MFAPQDPSVAVTTTQAGRHLSTPFGQGAVPLARDLGLPGEGGGLRRPPALGRGLSGADPAGALPAGGADLAAFCVSTRCAATLTPGETEVPAPAQPPCAAASQHEDRPDRFTPERRAQFLTVLAEAGSVRAACARVGVSAECVYRLRRRDPAFAAGWDGALVLARRAAEDLLAQRALEGLDEPIFYRGEQVGSRLRFDGRLLLAHLARLDAHAAASPHAAERAERFDELVALVAGEAPPRGLEPGQPAPLDGTRHQRHDAQLPPRRDDWIDMVDATLCGDTVSEERHDFALAAAAARWDRWQAAAVRRVDRLTGAGVSAWTLSTVSTPSLSAGDAAWAEGAAGAAGAGGGLC